jgi:hypothetical protein
VIQALLSRSDRRLAPVIAAARGQHDSLGGWKRAYKAVLNGEGPPVGAAVSRTWDGQPPPAWDAVVHGTWSGDRVLPWAHLQGPLPEATLARHRQDAYAHENLAPSSQDGSGSTDAPHGQPL